MKKRKERIEQEDENEKKKKTKLKRSMENPKKEESEEKTNRKGRRLQDKRREEIVRARRSDCSIGGSGFPIKPVTSISCESLLRSPGTGNKGRPPTPNTKPVKR